MPAPPCAPGCTCGKHQRSAEHNARIGMAVALTAAAKRNCYHANRHGHICPGCGDEYRK